ncbi:testis-expressed protein 2 [Halyomorpha halys]|uniref:testis-expressed protein 2 n=1 Tax=Halyomorpha halys TaxID=286706 RepID=UPI0006D525E9|nr:testis-expressed protein 2 [Halyomorpha halys]
MDSKAQSKGKAFSASTPSFSFRYNAEDEEVEQLYYTPSDSESSKKIEDSPHTSKEEGINESKSKDSSPILSKTKVMGNLDDSSSGETWRILKEMKGRITKTVEDKIEEIKSDRMKKKLLATSSLSDSEERSETSSSVKDSSEKVSYLSKEEGVIADSDLADISDTSLTPDRTTPVVTEVDISDITPSKDGFFTTFNTPTKKVSVRTEDTEKTSSILHKKLKTKSSKRVELGVEAVEESVGKEEGRLMEKDPVKDHDSSHVNLMPNVSVRAAVFFALLGVLYTFVNVPQFLFGVIVGIFLSFEFSYWASCSPWVNHEKAPAEYYSNDYPSGESYPSDSDEHQKIVYEGWINEFCFEYQPEIYHVTQTETVYARLEGSVLKLASPRQKVSKRAIWNEPHYKLRFDRERTYDISNCEVLLLPDKLAHKRIWSKKYPICIILNPDSHLGTRYRERGTSSLDFVSYKKSPKKGEEEEKVDEEQDGGEVKTPSKTKKGGIYLDEDDMSLCSDEEDDDNGLSSDYVKVPTSLINKNNIYLFARTDREKDIWFRRLVAAAKEKSSAIEEEEQKSDVSLSESEDFKTPMKPLKSSEHYHTFMVHYVRRKISVCGSDENVDVPEEEEESLVWLNMFLARILYDPMHDGYWIKQVQEKIQKKLSAIKVPTFMESLLVSHVELSESVPVIEKSCLPKLNCDGIWVDLDINYKGIFKMTIDTKINLIRLKNYYGTLQKSEGGEVPEVLEKSLLKPAIFDSEVEDSAESSGDEVGPEDCPSSNNNRRKTSQKVLQMVDKIASSKYFQQVTDNKYVKKALEGVSNTTISLVVQVKSLTGTVVINFPPPPSDRLWYGFRPNTKLLLSAKPKVGQRGINMVYITNYIEKKLVREFEKLLVMPNMDDLIIPLMNKEKPS